MYEGWHSDFGYYEIGEELSENKESVTYVVHWDSYREHHRDIFKNLNAAIERLERRREFWRSRREINEDAFFIEKRITNKVASIKTEKLDY